MDQFDGILGRQMGGQRMGIDTSSRGRDSLFLTATLRLADDPCAREVRIRNLSAGGMMAEYPDGASIGTVALLELRGVGKVTGRVAWSTEGRIGIALDEPIDPRRVRKPVGGGTVTPFYAKSVPR